MDAAGDRRSAADWPMPIKAFVIWLVILLWKRDAQQRRGLATAPYLRTRVLDDRFHVIEVLPQRAMAGLGQ